MDDWAKSPSFEGAKEQNGNLPCFFPSHRFLEATERLYAAEGQLLMRSLAVPEYLAHVEKRLREETERLNNYLDPNTKWDPFIAIVEPMCVGAAVRGRGCCSLVSDNSNNQLSVLCVLQHTMWTRRHLYLCLHFKAVAHITEFQTEKRLKYGPKMQTLLYAKTAIWIWEVWWACQWFFFQRSYLKIGRIASVVASH